MHYLVTGHTGFKGSWLCLMLQMQGHTVSGISLDPLEKSLFNQANLGEIFENDFRIDIRNTKELTQAIEKIEPEVIIHLAAQPLVRESYKDPIGTFETNVLGTLNVLEATKRLSNLKATLIITTDKVYKNQNHLRGYVETDELGGDDPYSASKAAADIATQSWVKSFATIPIAIARAGNVIGGGDWAKDRIVPDLVKSINRNEALNLRNPKAIRPWQHVLDCLNGYLLLVNEMLNSSIEGCWNFSPEPEQIHTVQDLAKEFLTHFGKPPSFTVKISLQEFLPESELLLLDSAKARKLLAWKDKYDFNRSILVTAEWYRNENELDLRELTTRQIRDYFES
jgi:CDP-glucose 4,6-dehydratase